MNKKRDPDASPGDKLLRLYFKLALAPKPKWHFLKDLAEEFCCGEQTIRRNIDILRRNIGNTAELEEKQENRKTCYRLRRPADEQTLGLDCDQIQYLALCRDIAAQHLSPDVADQIGTVLRSVALSQTDSQSRLPNQPIGFRNKGQIDYQPHLPVIRALRQAIDSKRICQVRYRPNNRKDFGHYRYAPGQIVAMSGTLYVQGYRLEDGSVLPERPTTFLIHRLSDVVPQGEYFAFDAADLAARRFGLTWHEPRRVAIEVDAPAADYVRDRVWSDDQEIEEQTDGSLRLHLTTTSEPELKAWVWSFGGLVRVA